MADYPTSFDRDALLACARGEMFGPGNPQLPLPPMLMMDRVTDISADGGPSRQGACGGGVRHRPGPVVLRVPFPRRPGDAGLPRARRAVAADRVQPRLARDAGRGRALGVGEVKFTGMVHAEGEAGRVLGWTSRGSSTASSSSASRTGEMRGGWRGHLPGRRRHEGRPVPGGCRKGAHAPRRHHGDRHRLLDRQQRRRGRGDR